MTLIACLAGAPGRTDLVSQGRERAFSGDGGTGKRNGAVSDVTEFAQRKRSIE